MAQQLQTQVDDAGNNSESDVHYTVLVRVPFPRGDFVDPEEVHWDAAKDKALWDIVSSSSNGREVNWHEVAQDFQVPLEFILQQVAWLYERQLSQVRAQMRKMGTQIPQGSGGVPMRRDGSGGSRVPSAMSVRSRESPGGPSSKIETQAAAASRGSSMGAGSGTAVQSRRGTLAGSRRPSQASRKGLVSDHLRKSSGEDLAKTEEPLKDARASPREKSPSSAKDLRSSTSYSDSNDEEESEHPVGDDDEEDDPAFLPFSASTHQGLVESSTGTSRPGTAKPQTSSEAKPVPAERSRAEPSHATKGQNRPTSSHLTPPAKLQSRGSPRKEGSDSTRTPSMGSSYSDLDDTSVTQSALEEALMSNMNQRRQGRGLQRGESSIGSESQTGVARRVSNISQAFRSRYLQ